jgi:NitT/TauT family transport system ATP-binding protein
MLAKKSTTPVIKGFVEVENLSVSFRRQGQHIQVLDTINFKVSPGEFACCWVHQDVVSLQFST